MEQVEIIEWQAPEFIHRQKHPNWYWVLGLATAALFLAALLTKNFLLALIVLLAAGTLALAARRVPTTVNVALTPRGLVVADSILPYRRAQSFCFKTRHEHLHLFVRTEGWLTQGLALPLPPHHPPEKIRHYLTRHLKEVEEDDTLSDALIHYLDL